MTEHKLVDRSALRLRIFWILLLAYPIILTFVGFSTRYGFLSLPRFGQQFAEGSLSAIKQMDPPRNSKDGYDGQFYIQMALDPTLQNPELVGAVDNIGYRAQRIGVSALAYALGLGNPTWVAQIYCLLNLVFWFLLCRLIAIEVGYETLKQRLVMIAILLSAGCLVSLSRALVDLPAVALGFLAIFCMKLQNQSTKHRAIGMAAAAYSALCRETGILSFSGLIKWPLKNSWLSNIFMLFLITLPVVLWKLYVQSRFGDGNGASLNMTWPLWGFANKWIQTSSHAWHQFPSIHVIEFLGPLSIAAQVIFMFRYWNMSSPLWRFGIGFAVLSLILGEFVWQTQSAYSRVVLPMTLAFNLMLSQSIAALKPRTWWTWFWIGNIGLLDRALPVLVTWLLFERYLPVMDKREVQTG